MSIADMAVTGFQVFFVVDNLQERLLLVDITYDQLASRYCGLDETTCFDMLLLLENASVTCLIKDSVCTFSAELSLRLQKTRESKKLKKFRYTFKGLMSTNKKNELEFQPLSEVKTVFAEDVNSASRNFYHRHKLSLLKKKQFVEAEVAPSCQNLTTVKKEEDI
ncbi:hypothetical protein EDC96DRAFT_561506 [Choanephora cucurbitarum]|nr:hypothetical protein EDC96DRAFT_561506 [Choanephora cucurbitarum]